MLRNSTLRRAALPALLLISALIVASCGPAAPGGPGPAERPPTTRPPTSAPPVGAGVSAINVPGGFGAQKGFWQVFFTAPTGSSDESTYTAGIDTQLAAAIDGATGTIDVAAYELNNERITEALLDAHARGVTVRVVTDDEAGVEDEEATISQLSAAGIPVVDDDRSALMHNKFVIIDSTVVWTGSWNFTINGTYRNNNNAIALRSSRAVASFQTEFDEMFTDGEFGPRSSADTPNPSFTQDGTPIRVVFAPEDEVTAVLAEVIGGATSSIRFMAFSFTLDDLRDLIIQRAAAGVEVEGIFDRLGSRRDFSEMIPFVCAGLSMREDGNPFILHHKVFIIDDDTVLTGS
ncbi:MAG: DUF1669 domain-containing protein, partial [Chloroflexi bacterium]|nr:DUF1669 domain-containing protein [Chloroflexota bacterium]